MKPTENPLESPLLSDDEFSTMLQEHARELYSLDLEAVDLGPLELPPWPTLA